MHEISPPAGLLLVRGLHELLIVDELGYLSFDTRGADLLYQVFNRRYQRAATIVTTNLPFAYSGKNERVDRTE